MKLPSLQSRAGATTNTRFCIRNISKTKSKSAKKNTGWCFSTEVKATCKNSASLGQETKTTKIVTYPLLSLASSLYLLSFLYDINKCCCCCFHAYMYSVIFVRTLSLPGFSLLENSQHLLKLYWWYWRSLLRWIYFCLPQLDMIYLAAKLKCLLATKYNNNNNNGRIYKHHFC